MRPLARIGALVLLVAIQAPVVAAPPELAPTVRFLDRDTLAWSPELTADRYNVYKAIRVAQDEWAYGHDCLALDLTTTTLVDAVLLVPGRLAYYLVTQVDVHGDEGPLGSGPDGMPRPPASPCTDIDGDGVSDGLDNCVTSQNAEQLDSDLDASGDACDDDDDNDGLTDVEEAALGTDPLDPDTDDDGFTDGDEVLIWGTDPLSADTDADTIRDPSDNCRTTPNVSQEDVDADAVGDACDNCPAIPNSGQENADGDAVGDVCEHRLARFVHAAGGGSTTGAAATIVRLSIAQTAAGAAASDAGASLLCGFAPRVP